MTTEALKAIVGPEAAAKAWAASAYEYEYACPKCHGSGYYCSGRRYSMGGDCWDCDGTGTLTRTRHDRRNYKSNLFALRRGAAPNRAHDRAENSEAMDSHLMNREAFSAEREPGDRYNPQVDYTNL